MESSPKEKCFHSFDVFLEDLCKSIEEAKTHIALNVYIFEDDATGRLLLRLLLAAAHRGVRVDFLVDGFGSREAANGALKALSHKNLSIRVYHPIVFRLSIIFSKMLYDFFSKMNKRDHKKLYVFDDQFYYVGSANFCDSSFRQRETMVKTESALSEAKNYFDYTWNNAHSIDRIGHLPFKVKKPKIRKFTQTELICNFNLSSRVENYKRLLAEIELADRIWLMTPYFVPPKKFLQAIGRRAQAGCDVKIILPNTLDIPSMKIAASYFYAYLMDRGARIFHYQNIMLHSKIRIIDNTYLVGSGNLDHRSFFTNLEVDLFVQSEVAQKSLETQFQKDLQNCFEIKRADLTKTPWHQRLFARLLFYFRRWL